MNRPGTHREAGHSLPEMAVGMAIASVASYCILKMAVLTFGTWSAGEEQIHQQEQLERAMRVICREIRQADGTTLVAEGSSIRFSVPEDRDGDGTVMDAYGDIEYGSPISYALYEDRLLREQDRDGDDLIEEAVPGERSVVVLGIAHLDFVPLDAAVQVTLVLDREDGETVTGTIPTTNMSPGA
jgi:hypothetical protein